MDEPEVNGFNLQNVESKNQQLRRCPARRLCLLLKQSLIDLKGETLPSDLESIHEKHSMVRDAIIKWHDRCRDHGDFGKIDEMTAPLLRLLRDSLGSMNAMLESGLNLQVVEDCYWKLRSTVGNLYEAILHHTTQSSKKD